MCRVLLAACLAVTLTCGALADVYFSDPSSINLLERWNKDGGYGLGFTANFDTGNLARLVNYTPSDYAVRIGRPSEGQTVWYEITYTFDEAVYIDRLACALCTNGGGQFGVLNYQWVDEFGEVMASKSVDVDASGAARITGIQKDPVLGGPRLTQSVTFRFEADDGKAPGFISNEPVGLVAMGAYLAAGQQLKMDGTYNVFWEENKSIQGSYNDPRWTDHEMLQNGGKPTWSTNDPLYSAWEFSKPYEFYGMTISHYDTGRFLADAMLEVWDDDLKDWRRVWGPVAEYRWVDNALGYIAFDDTDGPIVGTKVRLSWGSRSSDAGLVEISEFQLFGKPYEPIPEPSTMTLLAAGGVALLRRR